MWRFRVDEAFDVPGRRGLVACGTLLGGEIVASNDEVPSGAERFGRGASRAAAHLRWPR